MLPTWLKWGLTLGGAGLAGFAGYKIYESKQAKKAPEPGPSKPGTWLDEQSYKDKKNQIWSARLVGGAWEASSPMYGEVLHGPAGPTWRENLTAKIDAYVALNTPGIPVKVPPAPKSWEIPAIFGKCMDASQGGGSGCIWIPGYAQPSGWKPPIITSGMSLEEVISSFMKSNSDWKPPVGWVPGMSIPAGYPAPKDWNLAVIPEPEPVMIGTPEAQVARATHETRLPPGKRHARVPELPRRKMR